jgi:hypothetical protein
MNLELPADARIQIFVVPAGDPGPNSESTLVLPSPAPRRRLFLKGTIVCALVGGAYLFGEHAGHLAPSLRNAQAQSLAAAPPVPQGTTSNEGVPPAFAQQLQRPAIVTPPPGAPVSAAPGKNPFGLED